MPKESITEADLFAAERVTPEMAARYLGRGYGPQAARNLAKMGKIGCLIQGTNRVYIQPGKLVAFKSGHDDEDAKYRAIARALIDEGVGEIAAKVAAAIVRVVDETPTRKETV